MKISGDILAGKEIMVYLCSRNKNVLFMECMNIAVFASGSGSNCENLIQYFNGNACARVALVVSNKADAFVLERARRLGVPSVVVPKAELANP